MLCPGRLWWTQETLCTKQWFCLIVADFRSPYMPRPISCWVCNYIYLVRYLLDHYDLTDKRIDAIQRHLYCEKVTQHFYFICWWQFEDKVGIFGTLVWWWDRRPPEHLPWNLQVCEISLWTLLCWSNRRILGLDSDHRRQSVLHVFLLGFK